MDIQKKEEIIERIYYLLGGAYNYLYETGKEIGHWEDTRGTALAGIALDLKESPNSIWIRLVRNHLIDKQIKEGEVSGSWNEEIWDTSMCVMALKSFEMSSKDPIIKRAIEWIASLYQLNKRNNWHDEPWETSWAIVAILTAGLIPAHLNIEEPIDWLLNFQEHNGRIIAPHYTAYYLIICDRLKKFNLDKTITARYEESNALSRMYLKQLLDNSSGEILWSGEAWANGQILWAICLNDNSILEDEVYILKILVWFEKNQCKQGNWSDIEDTASAIIGLHKLLCLLIDSSEYLKPKSVRLTLQKRFPSPDIYVKRPFLEMHKETGGLSINLNNRFVKNAAVLGTITAGLVTVLTLIDFLIKLF